MSKKYSSRGAIPIIPLIIVSALTVITAITAIISTRELAKRRQTTTTRAAGAKWYTPDRTLCNISDTSSVQATYYKVYSNPDCQNYLGSLRAGSACSSSGSGSCFVFGGRSSARSNFSSYRLMEGGGCNNDAQSDYLYTNVQQCFWQLESPRECTSGRCSTYYDNCRTVRFWSYYEDCSVGLGSTDPLYSQHQPVYQYDSSCGLQGRNQACPARELPTYPPTMVIPTQPPTCGPSNCSSGCCYNNTCQLGNTNTRCGMGGARCVSCSSGQSCVSGVCITTPTQPPTCGPSNCSSGCCSNNICYTGDEDTRCGIGGACLSCSSGQSCVSGVCTTTPVICTPYCGTCTRTCGRGTQTCTRSDCSTYTQECNTQSCPIDGGWCDWGACSATCDGGTQSRICDCPRPVSGGADCSGPLTQVCNTQPCVTNTPTKTPTNTPTPTPPLEVTPTDTPTRTPTRTRTPTKTKTPTPSRGTPTRTPTKTPTPRPGATNTPILTMPPVPTSTPGANAAGLKFKVSLLDISSSTTNIPASDAKVEVRDGASTVANTNVALTRAGNYFETSSPASFNISQTKSYSVFIKTKISLGRLFSGVTLVPAQTLDCTTGSDTNCGELVTALDSKSLLSGDSDEFNTASGSYNKIDSADLQVLSGQFNTPAPSTGPSGDFNLDGTVDILDLEILGKNYGNIGD